MPALVWRGARLCPARACVLLVVVVVVLLVLLLVLLVVVGVVGRVCVVGVVGVVVAWRRRRAGVRVLRYPSIVLVDLLN